MPLSKGARLGSYEILSLIGAGGMGSVYKAKDIRLNRLVALKISNREFGERLKREARAIAALNHPNICSLFDVGPDYLVMEFVEGRTLAERITSGAILPEEVVRIAQQIAGALDAAHQKGIVHRDLKPANVMLTANGNVKVLDFGLAKAAQDKARGDGENAPTLTDELTEPGMVMGTLPYMSPEQARGDLVDKRTDIWAFGVVLYEMSLARRPFRGKTPADLLAAIMTKEPEWEGLRQPVRRLVQQCLEKDPQRRLRDIGDACPWLAQHPEAEEPSPPRTPRILLASLVCALTIMAAAYYWWPAPPASRPVVRLNVDLGPGAVANTGSGPTAILSPDGSRLLYTAFGAADKTQLFTRRLDQELSTPIAGTEGAISPFFSPDGQSIGFFADRKLKKTSLAGGGVTVLCDAPNSRGGSWGDDGNIYAVLDFTSPVSRLPSVGGAVQPVTQLIKDKREITHRWPHVLPGAQALLFTAHHAVGNFDEATVEMQSLGSGARRTLVTGGHFGRYAASGHLLFVRKAALYAAPIDVARMELSGPSVAVLDEVWRRLPSGAAALDLTRTGTLLYVKHQPPSKMLFWLDRSGEVKPLRPSASMYEFTVRFSPDGRRLAVASADAGSLDVWAYEWERDTMTRLTLEPSIDSYPVWAPNGAHLAFMSNRGGQTNIYWMRADGSGEAAQLTHGDYRDPRPYSFSPDGKRLAFVEETSESRGDLWTLSLDDPNSDRPAARKPELFLQTKFNEQSPMISPDGRWMAYESDESGANEIYVRAFPASKGRWQVSTGGGDSPVWSRTGPELFYRSAEGLMAARYTANRSDYIAARPRLLAARKNLGRFFDATPDGRRFVIVQDAGADLRSSAHVTLVENFHSELERRAPPRVK